MTWIWDLERLIFIPCRKKTESEIGRKRLESIIWTLWIQLCLKPQSSQLSEPVKSFVLLKLPWFGILSVVAKGFEHISQAILLVGGILFQRSEKERKEGRVTSDGIHHIWLRNQSGYLHVFKKQVLLAQPLTCARLQILQQWCGYFQLKRGKGKNVSLVPR